MMRSTPRNTLSALCLSTALALMAGSAGAPAPRVCTEASPDFLNPQFSEANPAYDVSSQIYERLVAVERGGSKLLPGLAESWEVSPDGLQVTFKLRPGVRGQSNRLFKPTRDLNADDVLFSFGRAMDPSDPYAKVGGVSYAFFESIIKSNLDRIEKVDAMTVRLHLRKPQAALLGALSVDPMSIFSAEYADAMLKAGTPERTVDTPIGTGPFQMTSYQKDATIRFRAFDEYWGKTLYPERAADVKDLIFSITPDAGVRFARIKSGECQIARYPNPGDLPALKADSNLNLESGTIADESFLAFNTEKKPFCDQRVSEA